MKQFEMQMYFLIPKINSSWQQLINPAHCSVRYLMEGLSCVTDFRYFGGFPFSKYDRWYFRSTRIHFGVALCICLWWSRIGCHRQTQLYFWNKNCSTSIIYICYHNACVLITQRSIPDSKVHWANMGPTWVLSAPDGPHVGPMNLAIRDTYPHC